MGLKNQHISIFCLPCIYGDVYPDSSCIILSYHQLNYIPNMDIIRKYFHWDSVGLHIERYYIGFVGTAPATASAVDWFSMVIYIATGNLRFVFWVLFAWARILKNICNDIKRKIVFDNKWVMRQYQNVELKLNYILKANVCISTRWFPYPWI